MMDTAVLGFLAGELFTPERCRALLTDVLAGQDAARAEKGKRRGELEAELADIGSRIARWTEAFEAGGDLAELGVDRLRELRARREVVQGAVRAEGAPASLPPFLYKPETLSRFTARLGAAFADPQSAIARAYLERLVDRIEILDGDVTVHGKAADVVAAMAEKGSIQPALNRRGKVRTYVVGWRPRHDSNVRPTV